MARFTGDFRGTCKACGEYVEFALGIRPGTDPIAMHFGPQGPSPIEVRDLTLDLMTDAELLVRVAFVCPLCEQRTDGRVTCRAAPPGPSDDGPVDDLS